MTGTINGVAVVCFPAKRTSEKSPAWRVLKSKPRDEAKPRPAQLEPTEPDDIDY